MKAPGLSSGFRIEAERAEGPAKPLLDCRQTRTKRSWGHFGWYDDCPCLVSIDRSSSMSKTEEPITLRALDFFVHATRCSWYVSILARCSLGLQMLQCLLRHMLALVRRGRRLLFHVFHEFDKVSIPSQ